MREFERIDDLVAALRSARESFQAGITCSLTWARERSMIWREAEVLGITDQLLSRMSEI